MSARPVLTTARFELWRPAAADLPDLEALIADEETRRFLGSFQPSAADSFARLLRNAGSWSLWGYGTFMVRRRGEAQIIANCGIFRSFRGFGQGLDNVPEAGWIVHRSAWGQGLAGEVMDAALAWFEEVHGPQRIACMIEEGHAASARVAAKLGFTSYGRHQDGEGPAVLLYERG